MSTPFDRQAQCPSCGAPITFKFAQAQAQVCKHCKAVVARSDQTLHTVGRVADLADIPTPFTNGAIGRWGNEYFVVDGRVQLDRANAPGAPWQEIFLTFPNSGRWAWLAYAQGRWYSTSEVEMTREQIPPPGSLRPGQTFQLGVQGVFTALEVGQRRVVSAEGEMPKVARPGHPTGYVDFAGPNGAFGTIDYGDLASIPPAVYLGRQIDVTELKLESGQPVEVKEIEAQTLACPNCGGNLPVITPGSTERVVCRYCGTASDFDKQKGLRALGQAPPPPQNPFIPLGQEGTLAGMHVICIGFVIRGCTVEGERYRWREYLLYAGAQTGYLWLMEEDGKWSLVRPISGGDVQNTGSGVLYRGNNYSFKQQVYATVEYVVGEFYWKVEVGEGVDATEFEGPGGKVSVEQSPDEVVHSFCEPLKAADMAKSFGLKPPPEPSALAGCAMIVIIVLVLGLIIVALAQCDDCGSGGGSSGGPVIIGPSYGGGK